MKKNYEALFLLHSLGDIIGYNNDNWTIAQLEDYIDFGMVNEYIYEFINMGGINGIDISKSISSNNVFFHIATAKTMLEYTNKIDKKFIHIGKNELIDTNNKLLDDFDHKKIWRNYGKYENISVYIHKFTDTKDAFHYPYDNDSNDNKCAIKSLCIGACFYGIKNRKTLIDISVRISKITHNSPIGFLGGLTTALFTAFAIEQIHLHKWPFELIKILKSKNIINKINKNNLDEYNDYYWYIHYWEKYINIRFKDNKVLFLKHSKHLILRFKTYWDIFELHNDKNMPNDGIGKNGYTCNIIAYDALLDCSKNWEKLVVYAILHPGDHCGTGAIAGGLYGILYGYGDVPKKLIENIENKKELLNISNEIYNKYNKD